MAVFLMIFRDVEDVFGFVLLLRRACVEGLLRSSGFVNGGKSNVLFKVAHSNDEFLGRRKSSQGQGRLCKDVNEVLQRWKLVVFLCASMIYDICSCSLCSI